MRKKLQVVALAAMLPLGACAGAEGLVLAPVAAAAGYGSGTFLRGLAEAEVQRQDAAYAALAEEHYAAEGDTQPMASFTGEQLAAAQWRCENGVPLWEPFDNDRDCPRVAELVNKKK